MIITTVTKKDGTKQTEVKDLLDIKQAAENTKFVWFADMDDKNNIISTNFMPIQNRFKDAILDTEKLSKHNNNYIDVKDNDSSILIFPLGKTVDCTVLEDREMLREARDKAGKEFFDKYEPKTKELSFKIPSYFLKKNATIHEGIKQNEESDTYSDSSDEQEPVDDSLKDEIMVKATNFIALRDGHVISAENKTFLYHPKLGTWDAHNVDQMFQQLYLWNLFRQEPSASKIAHKVLKAIKHLSYSETFPLYLEHNILVFENKVLSPVTRKEFDFNPLHYARNKIKYRYDPNMKCPKWLNFLNYTFKDDTDAVEKIQLLQEYMGLSLTNSVQFQKALLLFGSGCNGKSVILQVMSLLVGEDNVSTLALKDFGNRFGLVKLNGKLVNIDADLEYDALKAEGKFKSVVAGDEITVEEKYQSSFKFKPCAKLWMAANVLPRVKNNSHGYYRRFLILEFNNIVPKEEQNNSLTNELEEELSGILNWALEGLDRLLKNNTFTIPSSSQQAIETYELENNYTKQFVEDYLEIEQSNRLKKEEVYHCFTAFITANNYPKIDASRFGKELKALGVKDSKSGNYRYYHVKLKILSANDDSMKNEKVA